MKAFQKLALVSAIALTSSAFALEAADDATLANTTGQDGIRLGINPTSHIKIEKVIIHDGDGVTGATKAGAIVIGENASGTSTAVDIGIVPSAGFNPFTQPIIGLDIDATGDANNDTTATDPMLNIRVRVNGTTTLTTAGIAVANSDGLASVAATNVNNYSANILNGMSVVVGPLDFKIQLANEAQGHMIVLNTAISGGLTLNNAALNDTTGATLPAVFGGATITGGGMGASSVVITDGSATGVSGANLTLGVDVDVTALGLAVGLRQLGDATAGANVVINNAGFTTLAGATTSTIGTIELLGLKLGGTFLTISGK